MSAARRLRDTHELTLLPSTVAEHALSPVGRISASAWLARVELRPVTLESEGEPARIATQPEDDAVLGHDPDPSAVPLVRHLVALAVLGWHLVLLSGSQRSRRAMTAGQPGVAVPPIAAR